MEKTNSCENCVWFCRHYKQAHTNSKSEIPFVELSYWHCMHAKVFRRDRQNILPCKYWQKADVIESKNTLPQRVVIEKMSKQLDEILMLLKKS